MALNIATFKTRAATAGVFVVVMLAGMLWNAWSFFILFSIVHAGCWIEYQQLVKRIDKNYATIHPVHQYGIVLTGWCAMLYFTNNAFTIAGMPLHVIGWWMGIAAICAVILIELVLLKRLKPANLGWSLFGLLYISLPLALLVHLRCFGMSEKNACTPFDFMGFVLPLGILVALWINDTMAYMVGSFIGRTPFSKISPKKTWEGTVGGAVLCIVVVALLGRWANVYTVKDWAAIAGIVAVFGVLGDLFESKLKRMAGVKDSGRIMPGHGGFLDRFDSLLIATPFVWLYVMGCMK